MRISISQKVFLAFLTIFTVTAVTALILWVGIVGIRRSTDEIKALKDFHITVRGLDTFNWGPESRLPPDQKERFETQLENLKLRIAMLHDIRADLPENIHRDIASLDEQVVYYRNAFEELLQRQEEDKILHETQHRLMEALSTKVLDGNNPKLRRIFAEMLVYWGRAYHDRDIEAIASLRRLVQKARGERLDESTKALLEKAELTSDQSYLNYLGVLEREAFLSGTGKRFAQVSTQAVDSILRYEAERQAKLDWTIGGAVVLTLLLTLAFWIVTTRRVGRFLGNSHTLIQAIRDGRYNADNTYAPDDEFGDLIRFIREMGASLKESLLRARSSEEKFRRLVEDISDWVWETDKDGICIYSSPVSNRLLGLSVAEVEGKPIASFLCADDPEGRSKICRDALSSQAPQHGLTSFAVRADGSSAALESNWKPILDENGNFLGLRGVSRDATERLKADVERYDLQMQLVHAQKMEAIGTLSGGVAHDFNNLLQSIGGYADILMHRDTLTEQDRKAVEKILAATSHAGTLTQQLLLYSRRADTQFKTLDLNAEILRSCDLLERTIPKMIKIVTELSDDSLSISADTVQLEQVLMNLVINARDAMPDGGVITLRTSTATLAENQEESGAAGRYAMISVSDSGKGIPEEIRERIFEPFFTTKEAGKGTGLGLSIVYGIVKAHGGHIRCDSTLGKGTTFTLLFPEAAGLKPITIPAQNSADTTIDKQGSATILLVDDEASIRESCEEVLRFAGYSTLTASDGEEALKIFSSGDLKIDLVLMDLNMPGMGGAECCRRMLELDPSTRVVIATGFLDDDIQRSHLREKVVGFLKKPYRMKNLLDTIRNGLTRAHPADS